MAEIDWSLGRTAPNILGNALQGYQAGRQMQQDTARNAALAAYDSSNPGETANALLRAGDLAGSTALRQANMAEKGAVRTGEQQDREATARGHQAIANVLRVIAARTPDLNERRRLAEHAATVMFADAPPDVAEQLRQRVSTFDFSDDGIAAYGAQYVDQPTQHRMDLQEREYGLRESDTRTDNAREDRRVQLQGETAAAQAQRDARRLDYEGERIGIDRQRAGYEGGRLTLSQQAEERQRAEAAARMDRDARDPNTVLGGIMRRVAAGEQITAAEQRAVDLYTQTRQRPDPFGLGSAAPGGGGGDEYGATPTPRNAAARGAPPAPAPRNAATRAPVAPNALAPTHPATTVVRPGPVGPASTSDGPVVRREVRRGTVPLRPDREGVYRPLSAADMRSVPVGARFINPADGRVLTRSR